MEAAAGDPNLFATDLAEYLVKKGVPFREAHEIIGRLVARSVTKETSLNRVPLAEMKKLSPATLNASVIAMHERMFCRSVPAR